MLYLGPKIIFLYIAKFLIYLAPRASPVISVSARLQISQNGSKRRWGRGFSNLSVSLDVSRRLAISHV
jgi:hypothetical protein